jgi:hypothetical protein
MTLAQADGQDKVRLDPVIEGLRIPWDEVQLGRVLAQVLIVEARALDFAEHALDLARTAGNRQPEASAFCKRALPLPRGLECVDQATLFSTEGPLQRRIRLRGRVDLLLTDHASFELWIELKQTSGMGRRQARDYVSWSGAPLIVIANRPYEVPELSANTNWLGTILWKDLLPRITDLSESPSWPTVLRLLETELDDVSPYAEHWRASLREARDPLLPALRREIAKSTGTKDNEGVARWETRDVNRMKDGGYLSLRIPAAARRESSAAITIDLSGRTRVARLRVEYYPKPGWLGAPITRLVEQQFTEPTPDDITAAVIAGVKQLRGEKSLRKAVSR